MTLYICISSTHTQLCGTAWQLSDHVLLIIFVDDDPYHIFVARANSKQLKIYGIGLTSRFFNSMETSSLTNILSALSSALSP